MKNSFGLSYYSLSQRVKNKVYQYCSRRMKTKKSKTEKVYYGTQSFFALYISLKPS